MTRWSPGEWLAGEDNGVEEEDIFLTIIPAGV
jgi:hypothetical protein